MKKILAFASLLLIHSAFSAQQNVELFHTETGKSAGTILIEETQYGLLFTPSLSGLTPGMHGFHVHEHPSCDHKAIDALGHLDPQHTNKHRGPYHGDGHLGDLPQLYVNESGVANIPVFAPRLKSIQTIQERTLMVHVNPDNYSDFPEKLGGSGARTACGIIKNGSNPF